MGLFNKILKGLGFEDEEEFKEPKQKKVKKNKIKSNVNATFNLNEINELIDKQEKQEEKIISDEQPENNADFEVVKVKCQTDVQIAINMLKDGVKVLVNIESLNQDEVVRCLDFLTGAIYALGLKMQKIDDKIFLVK